MRNKMVKKRSRFMRIKVWEMGGLSSRDGMLKLLGAELKRDKRGREQTHQ